jgi:hypothetical protein
MTTCHMDEVLLNWKFKMATRRLFEHENEEYYICSGFCKYGDSFLICYAG